MSTLRGQLQERSDPLCEKYGLPVASLRLPEASAIPFDASQFTPGGKDLMGLQEIKLITDLVVAAVAAALINAARRVNIGSILHLKWF
jgi:hypothetical protein